MSKMKIVKKQWYTPEIVGLNSKFSKAGTAPGAEGVHVTGTGHMNAIHVAGSVVLPATGTLGGTTILGS